MFFKHFVTSAVVGFVAALVAGLATLALYLTPETGIVDSAADESVIFVAVDRLELARAYAREHGLTDCVSPAHARLDDVVLTFPAEPLAGAVITPVGFDEALTSGELGRWNVLACRPAEHAPGA